MSYKDVLRVFKLERELSDDETATLNTLRKMSPTDIEATVEAFGGTMGKVGKGAVTRQERKQRKFEHCEVCDVTRRGAIHKDPNFPGYHPFAEKEKKSARASSLSQAITGTITNNHQPPFLCTFSIDGKVCHGEESDGIHDKSLGYGNYHPFASSPTARNAVGQSSTSEQGQSSRTNSEDVSVAAGD